MFLLLLLNPKFAIALPRAMAETWVRGRVLSWTTDANGKGSGTSPGVRLPVGSRVPARDSPAAAERLPIQE